MHDCTPCPHRNACNTPCAAVSELLPREDHARLHGAYRRGAVRWLAKLEAERRATRLMLEHRHILRGRMRQVFNLIYNEGLSHEEVGQRLGIGRRAVGHYLERAYSALRKHIEKHKGGV